MINVHDLGTEDYTNILEKMKTFTVLRTPDTVDTLWLLEHFPVYTQGQAGKPEHILNPAQIPIIQSDRGGQVTYHGPGQLVAYVLMDLTRRNLGVRTLVSELENILISLLSFFDIPGTKRCNAPGVYVDEKKIASIGLRVKNGCTYHGLALNVNMNLDPFLGINPCGFTKLSMTQMRDLIPAISMDAVRGQLALEFITRFG